MPCERPCCIECGMAERDNHNHTVIPPSHATTSLPVFPSTLHTSRCVFTGTTAMAMIVGGRSARRQSWCSNAPHGRSHWVPFVRFPFAPRCRVASAPMALRMGGMLHHHPCGTTVFDGLVGSLREERAYLVNADQRGPTPCCTSPWH